MRQQTFRWEEELRSSFEEHATHSLWTRAETQLPPTLIQESRCSEGRADLVWATLFDDWAANLSEAAIDLLTQPTCSRILSLLKPTAVRSEEYLRARSGVSDRTFRTWLNCLFETGLVTRSDEGRWVLGPSFEFPPVEICSFEFKLANWRRALYQAKRYRTFSHRVFVVMPPERVNGALSRRDHFERFNVGLITHDVQGESEVLIPSRKRAPISRYRFIMAVGLLMGMAVSGDATAELGHVTGESPEAILDGGRR